MDAKEEMVVAFLDYHKFFDSFEPHFFSKFLLRMGIHPTLVKLFLHLNTQSTRRIRINGLYSEPFGTFNALGQGDAFTLLTALLFVSVQFVALDDICPELAKSAVVDDRTLRAKRETMLRAIHFVQNYDVRAGHLTNTVKLTLMATTADSREWCSTVKIGDKQPKLVKRDVLVGDVVTTTRQGNTFLSQRRTAHAINGAKQILKRDVPQALQQKACNTVAIPRLLACSLWTRPAESRLRQLRTSMVTSTVGRHRLMKCPEVVVSFIRNAAQDDPWGAGIADTVLKVRRMLNKSANRKAFFFSELVRLAKRGDKLGTPAPSPARALVEATGDAGIFLEVDRQQQKLTMRPPKGPEMDILHVSKKAVKNFLELTIRQKILADLSADVNGANSRRKDMTQISITSDRRTTP